MKKKILIYTVALLLLLYAFPSAGHFALADDFTRPILIMESYTVSSNISEGDDFVLEYTLRNMSSTTSVETIMLTVQSSTGVFFPSNGHSNQYYIDSIEIGSTHTGQIYLSAKNSIPDGVYNLEFQLSYQGSSDTVLSTGGFIALQLGGFPLTLLELGLPERCVEGQHAFVSVRYTNTSDRELRGVRLLLVGSIDAADAEISIGTVRAGATSVAEGYVTFTETGEQELLSHLAYEGDSGELLYSPPYTIRTMVSAAVTPPYVDPEAPETAVPEDTGILAIIRNNSILLIGGVALVCIIIVVTTIVRYRKRKR